MIVARLREDTLYEKSPTAAAPTSAGDLRFLGIPTFQYFHCTYL